MSLSQQAPWLKFYGSMPHSLDYPELTMYQLLAQTAEQYPSLCAYEFMGKKTSYRQFMARLERTARALCALGIGRGDRVTICMPNCPQAVDLFYALNRLGAVSNMVHPLSAPQEIAGYLNTSHSKLILTLDQFYPKVASIVPQLTQPVTILLACIQEELSMPLRLGYALTAGRKTPPLPEEGYLLWKDFLQSAQDVDSLPPDEGQAEDCASILYSGGTTGTTKGILLTNRNFNALALQTLAASGYENLAGMKMLSVMPIFHGFGLGIGIHTALIGGAECILVPQFSIDSYAKLLLRKKPNFIPGVPTLFEALLRAERLKNANLSFLRGVFSGGDSLSQELKTRVDAFLAAHKATEQIREGYGTTECVTASCLTPRDCARPGSIGIPFPDMFYKIVRAGTCDELEPGEEGEICLRGPTVMLGYADNPEETESALRLHPDGHIWLHTGDLGLMDADGFVYFRQRMKRMIVTSGYNVYPSQLENILDGCELVHQSCVIGVPDDYRMQRIRAYLVLKPGVQPSEQTRRAILSYCAERIAKYAMPRELIFRDELPKTLVGKVAYRLLEEEAARERAADK